MCNFPFQKGKKGVILTRCGKESYILQLYVGWNLRRPKKTQQTTQRVVNKIKILKYAMGNTYVQLVLNAWPDCSVFPFWTMAKDELQGLSDLLLLLPKREIKRAMYSLFRSLQTLKLEKMPMQNVGGRPCQSNHKKNYFTNNRGCFLFFAVFITIASSCFPWDRALWLWGIQPLGYKV